MEAIKSQNERIKQHLQSGRSLTPLEGLYQYGTWALSSRVSDLRKQGLDIKSELIEITSEGKTKRVSKYSLKK